VICAGPSTIPYATQEGEISICAYNTGVGWRQIIEKMHMTATLARDCRLAAFVWMCGAHARSTSAVQWKWNATMAITTPEQLKDRRFQLRATAREEKLIKVAAERQGVNVTDFILSAAREKAEHTLADRTRFVLDEKQWKAFLAALDRPAKERPSLRKLFTEAHVAERR
jgi:uncharacterized protein (DUF1778 family)